MTEFERKHLEIVDLKKEFPIKQGIVWLKWRFILSDTGKVIRKLPRRSYYRERKKLRKLHKLMENGKIERSVAEQSLQSWRASASRGDTYEVQKQMQQYFNRLFSKQSEGRKEDG